MSTETLLIFRLGSIGDTAIAMPCFRALARSFPNHHRILLTNGLASIRASSAESVLSGTDLIHETIYYPVGGHAPRKFVSLWSVLRELRVQTLAYLQPRPHVALVWRDLAFFHACAIGSIIGAPLRRELLECRTDPRTGEVEFEAERLARTLRPRVEVDVSIAEFDLQLTEHEELTAATQLQIGTLGGANAQAQGRIAIAPGAKWAAKDWGEKNWAALVALLASRGLGRTLIFVGAADERALAERLRQIWPYSSLNLCGNLTPRETAAVLARCELLVCHDSGPMHLAASKRTPCVALFGNLNRPHRWYPWGVEHQVIYEAGGVAAIGVQRVADAVLRHLTCGQARVVAA